MKIYAVVWDIASYDGNPLVSLWSTREKARAELERLSFDELYRGSVSIEELSLDEPENDSSSILVSR